jgi:hypothetical protein
MSKTADLILGVSPSVISPGPALEPAPGAEEPASPAGWDSDPKHQRRLARLRWNRPDFLR